MMSMRLSCCCLGLGEDLEAYWCTVGRVDPVLGIVASRGNEVIPLLAPRMNFCALESWLHSGCVLLLTLSYCFPLEKVTNTGMIARGRSRQGLVARWYLCGVLGSACPWCCGSLFLWDMV